jgi:hypothetical protein
MIAGQSNQRMITGNRCSVKWAFRPRPKTRNPLGASRRATKEPIDSMSEMGQGAKDSIS